MEVTVIKKNREKATASSSENDYEKKILQIWERDLMSSGVEN